MAHVDPSTHARCPVASDTGGPGQMGTLAASTAAMLNMMEDTEAARRRALAAEAEARRHADALERSNTDLRQFAYAASHDLQEPLRMVAGFAQLLERRYADRLDQDAREFIGFMVDGVTRMQRLLEDLLRISRVESQGTPPMRLVTDEVLEEVLQNLRVTIEESRASVVRKRLPDIIADRTQMVQLFQNLIGNAIKYSNRPPRVEIGGEELDHEWRFSVRDNGIGIPKDHIERIFVIFQRLHGREEYSGTGIGLALCKRIVERHGGRIWVVSDPGVGSTFRFTIAKAAVADYTPSTRWRSLNTSGY